MFNFAVLEGTYNFTIFKFMKKVIDLEHSPFIFKYMKAPWLSLFSAYVMQAARFAQCICFLRDNEQYIRIRFYHDDNIKLFLDL